MCEYFAFLRIKLVGSYIFIYSNNTPTPIALVRFVKNIIAAGNLNCCCYCRQLEHIKILPVKRNGYDMRKNRRFKNNEVDNNSFNDRYLN